MIAVPVMIVSAKTVQAILPILLLAAIAGAIARRRQALLRPRTNLVALSLFGFLLYAGLSALWAPDPQAAILIVLMAALVAAGSLVLAELLSTERFEDALHMGEGLWIGLLVGLLYTVVEIASGQAIKMWVYNGLALGPDMLEPARYFTWENGRIVAIHPDDLTRNVVPIPLLIWPALMAATLLRERTWRRLVCAALVLLGTAAILLGTSETAKLAWLLGFLTFAVARYSERIAQYAVSLVWIVACLGAVPLVRLVHALDLQNADWLQLSAQLRITLWNEIARLVSNAPVFGVGADMTYYIRPHMQEAPAAAPGWIGFPITHPHNVYLQTWYELGFVGAALLMAFGLLVLRQIGQLGPCGRPYALALFAAAAVQIAFSYNLWQIWFMCLFSFAAAMYCLGENLSEHHGAPPH